MTLKQLQGVLFPDAAENEEGFRQEILRQSHTGLRAIAWITIGAALFLMAGWWMLFPDHISTPERVATDAALVVIGVLELALWRTEWIYERARTVSLALVQITMAVLIGASLHLSTIEPAAEDFIPGQITLGVLMVVIALPLKPWQGFLHCAIVTGVYIAAILAARNTFAPAAQFHADYLLYFAMLAFLATGMAAVLYSQRHGAYLAYLQTLQATADLRQAEQRVAIAESASSMARLAAAISHELNTPIGALSNAIDTLLLLAAKQATAPPEQQARLVKLQADLRKSVQESAQRLQQIAARVARFTNLDQAELQAARINDLLMDVVELIRPRLRSGIALELRLTQLSEVVANPQRLSAVFYDLINNSVGALQSGGKVLIRTEQNAAGIRVLIEDNGHGIVRERISGIFDPGFQSENGRVASGNWSMFNARQIVREHGGEITLSSQPGVGTSVTITLPLRRHGDD